MRNQLNLHSQRIKEMMLDFKKIEQELIRNSKKHHLEMKRNAQKKQLEIINEAKRKKEEIIRKNLQEEKKMFEEMKRNKRNIQRNSFDITRNNNHINPRNLQPMNNQTRIANIIRVNQLFENQNQRRRFNGQSDQNIINNFINNIIENISEQNNERDNLEMQNYLDMYNNKDYKKIEEMMQEIEITDEIINKQESKQCLICLDDYVIKEKICYLPCFHFFHSLCIKSWIKRSNKCPLCKNIIKFD